MGDIAFGFQAAPASDAHKSDQALYREVMDDCALGQKLGFDAAWLLEHHFSDYYPTPSPLLFMAHIAAAFPDLSLGTSVLVLPWYHPLRLAEEIAMLNSMTRGTLHLGIGRGTAKMEYDAYNVDMNEARARFNECYRIVEKGLAGEPFTHDGHFWKIAQPIRIRPERVAELLILKADMPRSLHASMNEVLANLERVSESTESETLRRTGKLLAQLKYGRIDEILDTGLHSFLTQFLDRVNDLGLHISREFLVPVN